MQICEIWCDYKAPAGHKSRIQPAGKTVGGTILMCFDQSPTLPTTTQQ